MFQSSRVGQAAKQIEHQPQKDFAHQKIPLGKIRDSSTFLKCYSVKFLPMILYWAELFKHRLHYLFRVEALSRTRLGYKPSLSHSCAYFISLKG